VLTDWDSSYYREPLLEFLEWDLAGGPPPKWIKPRRRELIRDASMRFSEFHQEGELTEARDASIDAAE
jgi:hypothetical protein